MRATLTSIGAALAGPGLMLLLSGCTSDTDGSGSARVGAASSLSSSPTGPSHSSSSGTSGSTPPPLPAPPPSPSRSSAPGSTPPPAPPPPAPPTVTVTPERTGAHFVDVALSHPAQCTVGQMIEPVLTWTTKNATSVHVSVDNPGIVGGYGTYSPNESLTMPVIGCTGPVGSVIERRYDLHAATATPADHRTVTVRIGVVASAP